MKVIKSLMLSIFLLSSQSAYSASVQVQGKITFFGQFPVGVLVQLDTDNTVNPAGCANPGYYIIAFPFAKEIVLKSKFEDRSVILIFNDATTIRYPACISGRPHAYAVRIP